jgi:hypothetical protein
MDWIAGHRRQINRLNAKVKGNQVQSLNSPAAVMTESTKCASSHWVILGRLGKAKMSESEDLSAIGAVSACVTKPHRDEDFVSDNAALQTDQALLFSKPCPSDKAFSQAADSESEERLCGPSLQADARMVNRRMPKCWLGVCNYRDSPSTISPQ